MQAITIQYKSGANGCVYLSAVAGADLGIELAVVDLLADLQGLTFINWFL